MLFPKHASSMKGFWLDYDRELVRYGWCRRGLRGVPQSYFTLLFEHLCQKHLVKLTFLPETPRKINISAVQLLKTPRKVDMSKIKTSKTPRKINISTVNMLKTHRKIDISEVQLSKTHCEIDISAAQLLKTRRKINISASQKPPGADYLPAASQLFQRCPRDAQMPPRCLPDASNMTPLLWHLWYDTSNMTPLIWHL